MYNFESEFLYTLNSRGYISAVSEPAEVLDKLARRESITGYIGFDCTAPSLHIGSLLPIMMLYWMQQTGHRPIALMGGGTTRVGDPSGKDESRMMLTDSMINQNLKSISRIFSRFLQFNEPSRDPFEGNWQLSKTSKITNLHQSAIFANNAEWLNKLNYIDFLRDVGRHFSVNRMLAFDSVKLRLERQQELSFLEFNYMVLQAYDFIELYKRHGCILQMGGSDQWGNIVNGIDLGRRVEGAQLFALTSPLITTAGGAKMGKTAAGAVWLDANMTNPYDYWQYWRNTEDKDVVRFLKLFTILTLQEIASIEGIEGAEINDAKRILADETTKMIHGPNAAEQAALMARSTFVHSGITENMPTLSVKVGDGVLAASTAIGFTSSNTHARQLAKSGAMYLGNERITDPTYKLKFEDFDESGRVLFRVGSKKKVILTLKSE